MNLWPRLWVPPNQPTTARIEAVLALNEKYIDLLTVLWTLHNAYQTLPHAHQELQAAAAHPEVSLEWARALYEDGRRLQRLYKQLSDEGDD